MQKVKAQKLQGHKTNSKKWKNCLKKNKEQEANGLLSSLGIKTSLSKIPLG